MGRVRFCSSLFCYSSHNSSVACIGCRRTIYIWTCKFLYGDIHMESGNNCRIDASERAKTMALAIRTTKPTDLSIKINLDGNLNNKTVESFEQEIKQLLVNPLQTLILDLQDLQFISSSGIGALMKLKATLYRKKTELVTINLPPQIEKVFEILRLLPVMNVFENIQEMDHYLTKMQEKVIKENL